MKKLLSSLSFLFILGSCGRINNSESTISSRVVTGNLQYTLTSSRDSYDSGDTLVATIAVHNSGNTTDTIGVGAGLFNWSLVDDRGHILMSGGGAGNVTDRLPIGSGQTEEIYEIDRVVSGAAGSKTAPGKYELKASVGRISLSLNLRIR